jgi:uncharacterized protein with von Willebrand factor type A (vWA) domain
MSVHHINAFDQSNLQKMQQQMLSFMHFLKGQYFHLDIETQYVAQQLLSTTDFSDPTSLQHSLRCVVCKDLKQWRKFDELYRNFWLPKDRQLFRKTHAKSASATKQNNINKYQNEGGDKEADTTKGSYGSSAQKNLSARSSERNDQASALSANEMVDFALLDNPKLIQDFTTTCTELVKHLAKRLRKRRNASSGEQINLKHTMQQSIKNGGELIDLVFLKRPKVKPNFTVIIDVSRSMTSYSNAFMIFAWALVKILPSTRVFVFNTGLKDISTLLREKGVTAIQKELALINNSWGGGTRIATSLQQLGKHNIKHKRGTHYVIVHSDGLDTDPPLALAQQLKILKKQCRTLFWLSPLLKGIDYKVETASLKNSLIHIDHFLPIHNMYCLTGLVKLITSKKTLLPPISL